MTSNNLKNKSANLPTQSVNSHIAKISSLSIQVPFYICWSFFIDWYQQIRVHAVPLKKWNSRPTILRAKIFNWVFKFRGKALTLKINKALNNSLSTISEKLLMSSILKIKENSLWTACQSSEKPLCFVRSKFYKSINFQMECLIGNLS